MKLFLLALAALALVQAAPSEKEQVYENIHIVALLNDDAARSSFFDCMLGKTVPCKPKDAKIKPTLSEIFLTDCAKCTDWQKSEYKKALKIMNDKYPEQLKTVAALLRAEKNN